MKNIKRILALIGVGLLLLMYICTLVFALIDSPNSHALFMASLYCTIVIPVIIYAGILVARNAENKKELPFMDDEEESSDDGSEDHRN